MDNPINESFMHQITLQKIRALDISTIVQLANEPEISKYLRDAFPHPYTLSDGQSFYEWVQKQNPTENLPMHKGADQVGIIGAHPHPDIHRYTAELGYWIGKKYWNQGIVTKAIDLMLHYCFEELDFKRVQAITFDSNIPSMQVLEKNYFKKEGILRRIILKNGQFFDAHLYALLREEYKKN